MRPLTAEEERDNAEFKHLAAKIAKRDAGRGAHEAAHQAKRLYLFTMKEAGKGFGILNRRILKHHK